MTLQEVKDWVAVITSCLSGISLLVGGVWVVYRFILQQERYPNINFTAEINVIGFQDEVYLIELIAIIDNRGKAQHKMNQFHFDLNALNRDDAVTKSELWGNQTDFGRHLASGSFLPHQQEFFLVDPGTTAKYSHITHVPKETSFLLLHSNFQYFNRKGYSHTAEKTLKIDQNAWQ